jgi:hypothetical protein
MFWLYCQRRYILARFKVEVLLLKYNLKHILFSKKNLNQYFYKGAFYTTIILVVIDS